MNGLLLSLYVWMFDEWNEESNFQVLSVTYIYI